MLKTLFFSLYALINNFSFYLLIVFITLVNLFLNSDTRKKFITFLLLIIVFGIWGFSHDLDGIFLVFLVAEFTIFLLLLMTYLQLYSNFTFVSNSFKFSQILLLPVYLYFIQFTNSFYTYISFYKTLDYFVSSDFYILYYFLFEKIPVLVVFFTLIISFFSLFFILMYFSLKLKKLDGQKKLKNLYFLKKQVLVKQVKFESKLYTFQN